MKNVVRITGYIAIYMILAVGTAQSAVVGDYCITPAFIQTPILPNLLLLIDNSASMYDLAYSDNGRKTCSTSTSTYCTTDAGCPPGQTCSKFSRQPYYCFDQSFSTATSYTGYFDPAQLYKYDFTANEFVEDNTAFSCVAGSGETAKSISGQLCVVYSSANKATVFKASGSYLNWLTASKFDVEKKILTGGKYNGVHLLAESRGCVGQSFIKKANTADFINFNSPESNNLNTSLGITFGVRGPYDPVNAAAPSPGGQTYLDIFKGNYNQGLCQLAMDAIVSGGNADIKKTVDDCLASTTATTAVTKAKVAFQQSMQACWQMREGHAIGIDDINTVKNQCTDVYTAYATCSNDPKKVCTTATVATDCGSGNSCNYGPAAIVPGNSALLCGNEYEGQYYYYQGGGTTGTCTYNGAACTSDANCSPTTFKQCKKTTNNCTTDADCPGSGNSCFKTVTNTCSTSAVAAGWSLIPGVTDAQMIATHTQFCNDFTATPATDPTDSPSDTSKYENVPAILSGTGVEAQLGQPIGSLTVRIKKATAPTGVINDFSSQIRLGVMSFNDFGSATEVASGILPVPKLCSNDATKACTSSIDCVSPGTCDATVAGTNNRDGGKILYYIGKGRCSVTSGTVCYNDAGCPSTEKCVSDGVGTYSSGGVIQTVNNITANSWTPFAEAFYDAIGYFAKTSSGTSRTDLRLNTSDFDENRNPSQYSCQANNILLITDGMSTADRNSSVDNLAKLYTAAGGSTGWTTGTGGCPTYGGSVNVDNMAWIGRNLNISTFSKSTASAAVDVKDKASNQYVTSFVVFNGDSNGQAGECDSKTLLSQTAVNGGTSLFQAVDPDSLNKALYDAFKQVASGLSSGTAASILSNSEGSGANLLQAVFYPEKTFEDTTKATWTGEMQNMWYYVDPFIANSTVREDTDFSSTTPDHILNLKNDYVARFYFDKGETKVELKQDTDGDGLGNNPPIATAAKPDDVKSLWRAGKQLWARTADSRTIHTSVDGYSLLLPTVEVPPKGGFYTGNTRATALQPYLQASSTDSNAEAIKIINYVRGTDQSGYRSRTVKLSVGGSLVSNVWKLGDIISSTPRLQSTNKLNFYNLAAPAGYSDKSYGKFIKSAAYSNRGMAYVGANDGMLHAFKLGKLTVETGADTGVPTVTSTGTVSTLKIGGFNKATLTGTNLGEEQWAFIPRSALPYLKYYTDSTNYKHIYYLDGPTVLSDISVNKTGTCATDYSLCPRDNDNGTNWSTVLIGSMGLGGASKLLSNGCITDAAANGTCVKTPIFDPDDTGTPKTKGVGYSSYFALDITNQYFNSDGSLAYQPVMKWEFPPRDAADNFGLGYATSGAAIVRIAAKKTVGGVVKPDTAANGKWFAVFASGPTGPIDTTTQRFMGKSNQNLKLFVVDLGATVTQSAPFVLGTNYWVIDTGIADAFGGSLVGSAIDTDKWDTSSDGNYQDDALYVGYTKKRTDSTGEVTWTDGGVGRLLTKESTNPSEWVFSKVIDGIGPVTTGIARLQDRKNKKLWLYFGTGRFFNIDDDSKSSQSAANNQRYLMGIQEECYTAANKINPACAPSSPLTLSNLKNQTTSIGTSLGSTEKGWYVELDAKNDTDSLGAERSITDAVALTNGGVFFTTFKPTTDVCKYGGYSYVWGFNYATGGAAAATALTGKVLIQVSTGAFEEVSLSSALTANNGRKMGTPMIGKPPVDAPPIISSAGNKPQKKILHIQER
ncbi:MAG: hypothetical protein GJV46_10880 [Geobacter sp.]|nr:hypothetical protein [Geobacter sp.]